MNLLCSPADWYSIIWKDCSLYVLFCNLPLYIMDNIKADAQNIVSHEHECAVLKMYL